MIGGGQPPPLTRRINATPVTVEYRETPDGPWKVNSTQYEEGSDRKVMTLTLWRYR